MKWRGSHGVDSWASDFLNWSSSSLLMGFSGAILEGRISLISLPSSFIAMLGRRDDR